MLLQPNEINHAENIIRALNKGTYNDMKGIEIMAFFHSLTWLAELARRSKEAIDEASKQQEKPLAPIQISDPIVENKKAKRK